MMVIRLDERQRRLLLSKQRRWRRRSLGSSNRLRVDARTFSPTGAHAGTVADPWPGVAIKLAIDSMNDAEGTVFVANGVWSVDAAHTINRSNWTLEGESLDAVLRFVEPGQLWFGSTFAPFSNTKFTGLTVDCRNLSNVSNQAAIRFSNAVNHTFNRNKEFGHANGAVPGIFWEGSGGVSIVHNNFDGFPTGGDNTCQVQAGPSLSLDSGFLIADNTFHETGLVTIGVDNCEIRRNVLTTTIGFISILCCGKFDRECVNVIVDGNTVNAGGANGCAISGLPNDPGGTSIIRNFRITNNTVIGLSAAIHCQSFDNNNYLDNTLLGNEKRNVTITGNILNSSNGGSGIDLRGGAGLVDTVEVAFNTLSNTVSAVNAITMDVNTINVNIHDNVL